MFRPGWRFLPVPALAACLVLGVFAGEGLSLAGFRAGPAHAATGFLSVADDVPLMPGLTETADTATVFDKPAGRIVTAEASGRVTPAVVRQFYASTLPQLGWQAAGDDLYRREAEQLRLSFPGSSGAAITVRFELLPNR